MTDDWRQLVRRGYERGRYAEEFRGRTSLTEFEHGMIERYLDELAEAGAVLDLGCGTGLPYARYFVERGCDVTGVDFAANHIAAARENVPEASFVQADVAAYWSSRDTYDGVVCLYTLFHLPRDEHTSMLATLADQLRSGGPLLMTFGADGGEFVASDWCGAEMAWSSFAPSTYRRLLAEAGFGIVHDGYEGEPTSEEHHWWVLAVNQS